MSRRAPFSATLGRETGPQLWVLHALPPATARDVDDWIERIAEMPLDAWLRVADRCPAPGQTPLALTRACRRVDEIIAGHNLEFTAWVIRDLVAGATYRVRSVSRPRPRRERERLFIACVAAEWMALAKACRPWLSPEDRALLRAPFSHGPAPRALALV